MTLVDDRQGNKMKRNGTRKRKENKRKRQSILWSSQKASVAAVAVAVAVAVANNRTMTLEENGHQLDSFLSNQVDSANIIQFSQKKKKTTGRPAVENNNNNNTLVIVTAEWREQNKTQHDVTESYKIKNNSNENEREQVLNKATESDVDGCLAGICCCLVFLFL